MSNWDNHKKETVEDALQFAIGWIFGLDNAGHYKSCDEIEASILEKYPAQPNTTVSTGLHGND